MKTEIQKKSAIFLMVMILMGSLIVGCAHESSTHKTTQNVNGETVVTETKTVDTDHDHTGVLGGAFHVIGEIIAFPFEVIAGVFRFIF